MIHYRPGDVVLLPFPFTDLSTIKQRPAVVISSSRFNKTHSDIVVAAITSHIAGTVFKTDYRIPKDDQIHGGLPKPSLVKCSKVVTIDQRLIRKKLGSFSEETTVKILKEVQCIFIL